MRSLSKPRCARGQSCYHVLELRSEGPPTVGREGELCAKCREAGYSPEDAPEEYRELLCAARVLFEEDVTDENVIIPTLAFAANTWEMQDLGYIRNQFLKAKEESEAWRELQAKFINTFDILCVERVAGDGKTLIVRTRPLCVYLVQDEQRADLVKEIVIDIYSRSVKGQDVAQHYKKGLLEHGISEDWRMASIDHKVGSELVPTNYVRIIVRPENPQIDSLSIPILKLPLEEQPSFPSADLLKSYYDALVHSAKASGFDHVLPSGEGREKGGSSKAYNLIPACTAWYIGEYGRIAEEPSPQTKTKEILKKHLLEPCAQLIRIKTKDTILRDVRSNASRFRGIDKQLRTNYPKANMYF